MSGYNRPSGPMHNSAPPGSNMNTSPSPPGSPGQGFQRRGNKGRSNPSSPQSSPGMTPGSPNREHASPSPFLSHQPPPQDSDHPSEDSNFDSYMTSRDLTQRKMERMYPDNAPAYDPYQSGPNTPNNTLNRRGSQESAGSESSSSPPRSPWSPRSPVESPHDSPRANTALNKLNLPMARSISEGTDYSRSSGASGYGAGNGPSGPYGNGYGGGQGNSPSSANSLIRRGAGATGGGGGPAADADVQAVSADIQAQNLIDRSAIAKRVGVACLSSMVFGMILAAPSTTMNYVHISLDTCGVRENVSRDWDLRLQNLHDQEAEQEYAKYLAAVAAFEGREAQFVSEVKKFQLNPEKNYYFFYPFSAPVCRAEMRRLTALAIAFTLGAAILGAVFLSGSVADAFGRRGALLRSNFLGVVAALLTCVATSWETFLAGRFLQGLVLGMNSVLVPMYVGELCPKYVRGKYVTWITTILNIGAAIAAGAGLLQTQAVDFRTVVLVDVRWFIEDYSNTGDRDPTHDSWLQLSNVYKVSEELQARKLIPEYVLPMRNPAASEKALVPLSELDHIWWRFVFGLQIIPCIIAIVLWIIMFPEETAESPVWLIRKKKPELAKNVLLHTKKTGEDAERAIFKDRNVGAVGRDGVVWNPRGGEAGEMKSSPERRKQANMLVEAQIERELQRMDNVVHGKAGSMAEYMNDGDNRSPLEKEKDRREGKSMEDHGEVMTKSTDFANSQALMNDLRERRAAKSEKSFSWALASPKYRVGALTGVALSIFQQLTGTTYINYSSSELFWHVAGNSVEYVSLLAVCVPLIQVFMSVFSQQLIDTTGRRLLLVSSGIGCLSSMAVAFAASLFLEWNWVLRSVSRGVMIFCIFLFTVSYSIGWGPVQWVYLSEIYPTKIKGACMSVAVGANWGSALVTMYTLERLNDDIVYLPYLLLSVLNFLGLVFVLMFVVETAGTDSEMSPIYNTRLRKMIYKATGVVV